MIEARFGHVNLIARDWRALADFYTRMLGCEFVPPERDYRATTSPPGPASRAPPCAARISGCPGTARPARPSRSTSSSRCPTASRRREPAGLPAHRVRRAVGCGGARRDPAAGGRAIGSVVTLQTADGRFVTWTYVTDPEENIIELQSWSDTAP